MGDRIAPSPHKGGKGKAARKRGPNRRKSADAAPTGGASCEKSTSSIPKYSHDNRFDGFPGRGSWIGKTAFAALDLGTNNCRLLIARASQDGFTVVDAFSRVVRLGEGLATTGKMSDEAMDRAIEALSVCADKLKRRNVVLARSVATEACRQAVNGAQFIERV
ncbi:MAG: hypothetical protein RIQ28_188, partial [Pseudomonadota bacterium]